MFIHPKVQLFFFIFLGGGKVYFKIWSNTMIKTYVYLLLTCLPSLCTVGPSGLLCSL